MRPCLANASDIYDRMLKEKKCAIILTLSGSTSAAGCMQVYLDMVKNNMIDAIVSTGASIVDMDFFEALGFKHYQGTPFVDDKLLRKLYIDTVMGIEPLQTFDKTISQIPIVGWVLTGEKGTFIVINLHVLGPVENTSVTSKAAGSLTKSVADSLLRILKLPRDFITKPGDVFLPGAIKNNGNKKP